jgi:hypothetical protein
MEVLLIVIAGLLLWIAFVVGDIRKRLRERFPTEREQDYEWSQKDRWDIGKRTRMTRS